MQNNKIRITMKKTMNNGQTDMFSELVEKKNKDARSQYWKAAGYEVI